MRDLASALLGMTATAGVLSVPLHFLALIAIAFAAGWLLRHSDRR